MNGRGLYGYFFSYPDNQIMKVTLLKFGDLFLDYGRSILRSVTRT